MNKASESNLFRKNLTAKTVRVADASAAAAVIAAPGAGYRIRLYWASISQQGTAACDVALAEGANNFFKIKCPNDGTQKLFGGDGNYKELDDNVALNVVATDQATDSIDVNVLYTIEDI